MEEVRKVENQLMCFCFLFCCLALSGGKEQKPCSTRSVAVIHFHGKSSNKFYGLGQNAPTNVWLPAIDRLYLESFKTSAKFEKSSLSLFFRAQQTITCARIVLVEYIGNFM